MKTTLITSLLVFLFLSLPYTSHNVYLAVGEKTYCDGFKKGYVAGACFENPFCIEPVTPLCPNPIPNFTEYKDGYQRGFKEGLKAREKKDN
jgi:hypothetical protein